MWIWVSYTSYFIHIICRLSKETLSSKRIKTLKLLLFNNTSHITIRVLSKSLSLQVSYNIHHCKESNTQNCEGSQQLKNKNQAKGEERYSLICSMVILFFSASSCIPHKLFLKVVISF